MRKMFLSDDNIERLKRTERIAKERGYTPAQIALAWLLNGKINVFPIVGSSRIESLEKNIQALDISLTQEELSYINLEREEY